MSTYIRLREVDVALVFRGRGVDVEPEVYIPAEDSNGPDSIPANGPLAFCLWALGREDLQEEFRKEISETSEGEDSC
tara:strand:+ start:348 stop:578 length:231 start_codon:yes stop_codon:yes gene_type:complete